MQPFIKIKDITHHIRYGRNTFKTEDDFGEIFVFDRKDKRVLTFGSIYEQSCISKSRPHILLHQYTQAMITVLLFSHPKKATMLGLGGGALVHSLLHTIPDLELKVVELRSAVIDVATKYFFLPQENRLEVIQQDAYDYLNQKATGSTQLILSDTYLSSGMDIRQASKLFVKQCHRVLSHNGWLVCNLAAAEGVAHTFLQTILESFKTVYVSTLPTGNIILYACTENYDLDKKALKAKASAMEAIFEFPVEPFISRLTRFS
ncbi:spermidine synthase [Alkalimarinus alittae]|uniref:Methyltransferase n=1 Tax=Alkalimarinus alittae TaxID=2961619 RepID=A0ABY6N2F1_9ALTE|nr:methyltransferase [Alkalimarinus alittae]UZE96276.1 methyltransferase [Alkalimarinus alittae]